MIKSKGRKGKGKIDKTVEEEVKKDSVIKAYDSDLWTLESYTVSVDVFEPASKKPNPETSKNETKSSKKLEEKNLKPLLAPAEPNVFNETMKMKAEAEAALVVELGPNGENLSKKERQLLAKKMAEQAELDDKKAEEEERIRSIKEHEANIEKEIREAVEQPSRIEQLTNSMKLINSVHEQAMKRALEDKEKAEWEQFLKCDGLPDPYYCGQMNNYLHLWSETMEQTTMDDAVKKSIEVLQLLEILYLLIDDPSGATKMTIENWKWVLTLFKKCQQESLNTATYRLLRDVQKNLRRINLRTADFRKEEENFTFCLFVMVQMPASLPNPKKRPNPQLLLDFPEMSVNVVFPTSMDCVCMGFRAMYLKYDHLSDLCSTFYPPTVPEEYQTDLCTFIKEDWRRRMYYKYEEYRKEQGKNPLVDKKDRLSKIDPETEVTSIPKLPYIKLEVTSSQYCLGEEEKMAMAIRNRLCIYVEDDVINLRKNVILGGTYYLDLYYQPPQPRSMASFVMSTTVTRLERPPFLDEVPFYEPYVRPLAAMKTPKEIDEEMKKIDEALQRLILVTLTLPKHVLWFETPFICQWDRERKLWSTADITDFHFTEETNLITFRTSKFGCFGIGSYRFSNLPLQSWEIKPEQNGSITFQITAAIVSLQFNIKDNMVCLTDLQNGPSEALQDLVGTYYQVHKLIRMLREGGVDIFPSFDAFCYIEGTCEKQWQMERHLYHCMAQLSVCYNFSWSRWNNAAGRRICVMLMRGYNTHSSRQVPYSTLMVTPFRSVLVDCTESNDDFLPNFYEGMVFCSDLIHLMKATCSMPVRTKVFHAPGHLIATITKLLLSTRILSFSS